MKILNDVIDEPEKSNQFGVILFETMNSQMKFDFKGFLNCYRDLSFHCNRDKLGQWNFFELL